MMWYEVFGVWLVGAVLTTFLTSLFTNWLEPDEKDSDNDGHVACYVFWCGFWFIAIPVSAFFVTLYHTFKGAMTIGTRLRKDAE